ncbi:hypothetical protein ACFPRL_02850 [Pseudoclavibacter helvolus]
MWRPDAAGLWRTAQNSQTRHHSTQVHAPTMGAILRSGAPIAP